MRTVATAHARRVAAIFLSEVEREREKKRERERERGREGGGVKAM